MFTHLRHLAGMRWHRYCCSGRTPPPTLLALVRTSPGMRWCRHALVQVLLQHVHELDKVQRVAAPGRGIGVDKRARLRVPREVADEQRRQLMLRGAQYAALATLMNPHACANRVAAGSCGCIAKTLVLGRGARLAVHCTATGPPPEGGGGGSHADNAGAA
eukprot:364838-Chlamydomonas_euryale.AAC.7